MRTALSLLVFLLATTACSSDSDTAGEGEGPDDGEAVSFTELYQEVLAPRCAGCHGDMGAGGLSMASAESARANLIGVDSGTMACGGQTRVVPGDADGSLLLSKVTGTDLCGELMPINGEPLSADEIASIRAWIDGGAEP